MSSETSNVSGGGEDDLRTALDRQEFFLVYQPEIALATNAFAGVEALLRWRRADGSVLMPDQFVASLEENGQILRVGRWALVTACEQGSDWHDKGYRFSVSLNVAPAQLLDSRFVSDVDDALGASGFDPSLLTLEFSTSNFAANEELAETLVALKEFGVRLAVDDFVPGQSSWNELKEYSIDVVKLDRSFIAELTDAASSVGAMHAMMEQARATRVQVVASGIEDAEQRRRLQLEDVSAGQGYLFSTPHEADDIDRYLEDFSIFSGKPL